MFVYALIIFLIPFFLIYRRNHFDNRPGGVLNGQAINQVVDSLTREKFSSGAFNNDLQCPICYVEYDPADEITQLSCDPKHYFHNDCIVAWISKGNNSCPMCRKEIKQMM
ncbi:hypothetical protein FGO68_gene17543 [Halteria grandinella]|uniref:RING-type domain-containing protein n=1 Tax=Halteria grandinella TaxID=5974 RepID=A0A8J8NDL8_HALGN|nr:hypothetical protein FGO68_gene17543 [Halteria grandinella]